MRTMVEKKKRGPWDNVNMIEPSKRIRMQLIAERTPMRSILLKEEIKTSHDCIKRSSRSLNIFFI